MNIGLEWLDAFPIRPAAEAVDALCESWSQLTQQRLAGFHPEMKEPALTRALKAHVESVTARERGLLGMWSAESVINVIDPVTARIREERRNDIVYGWNNNETAIQIVFEFKKMSRSASDRKHYLGANGLERFVTGIYSRQQPVAAMVGMLMDPISDVLPPLLAAFETAPTRAQLRIRCSPSGTAVHQPSKLFPQANFDTDHDRPAALAPSHGSIRIAHFVFAFGYPHRTTRAPRKAAARKAVTRTPS